MTDLSVRFNCSDGEHNSVYNFSNLPGKNKKIIGNTVHLCCKCHLIVYSWSTTNPTENIMKMEQFFKYHNITDPQKIQYVQGCTQQ